MTTFTIKFRINKEDVLQWYIKKFGEPERKQKLKAYHSKYSENWHVIKIHSTWKNIFFAPKEIHWVVFNEKGEVIHEKP